MFRFRKHAGFLFAENAIAIPGDDFVDCVSKRFRQHAPNAGEAPNTPKLFEHVEDCIRTREESLVGLVMVLHDVDRVQIMRVNSMTS